jgi:uncharacterized protein with FMN-binding domain
LWGGKYLGTKIFVVRLSTIIKYALAVLLAVILIVWLCTYFASGRDRATYSPGSYSAEIILHSKPVSVQVTVGRHSIDSIEMLNMSESEAVFYPVFEQSFDDIAQQVVALQSTDNVSLSEDNAVTGGIILDAIDTALSQAQK